MNLFPYGIFGSKHKAIEHIVPSRCPYQQIWTTANFLETWEIQVPDLVFPFLLHTRNKFALDARVNLSIPPSTRSKLKVDSLLEVGQHQSLGEANHVARLGPDKPKDVQVSPILTTYA